ncbi:hypothetical protein INT45_002089 [Circinella minor]|uniref:Uncharacterized protein n=1 Tax=Circinella minor TaxID=1195481 RepID=A0A8H7SGL2_9FUNG|nr:hypothetical protein INT45_002089 [Circinella minor]
MTRISGQIQIDAASVEENVEIVIKSANVISDLARSFTRRAGGQVDMFEEKRGIFGEDTSVHQVVTSLLRNIFYGPLLGANWSNSQLAVCGAISASSSSSSSPPESLSTYASSNNIKESKLLPDITVYAFVRSIRFDLLAVEVKPPGSGKGDDDKKRKVATEMHIMLDKLVDKRIESPSVCGISVDVNNIDISEFFTQQAKCSTYILDLKYDGIYRLVELGSFELPSSINDVSKAKQCLAAFLQLKVIVTIFL